MDQGLKERLVGAAVLVAIGVWLIPWVLDGPENPVDTGPASLQLPAAEEPVPMRTQTLKLGEPPAAAQPAEPAEPPAETVVATAAPEPAAPAPAEATTPADAPTPAKPPPVAATAPKPTPAPQAAEPPRKAAATAVAPAAKGEWTVQLGSFGDEGNARRLADRASTLGYKANVASYRTGGKTMYRVRVGSFAAKAQAEATASALGAHGITARVIAAD